ncbi:MAG: DUF1016 domain-containing protein [Clostridia bacterium]|nr:DUF1016 domain-containing protein [Clostridia bacterium]
MGSHFRMFDELRKKAYDNPAMEIILCSEKNEAIADIPSLMTAKDFCK